MPGGTAFARPTIRTFPGPVSEAPPGIFLLVEQRVQLTTILRRQRIAGAQRGQDLLEHLARLTVCGSEVFLQVAKQQFKRFFVTPDLMQLQRQLACQSRIGRVVSDLLLQLLNFRRICRLFQQFNLRDQSLIAGVLILQGNRFEHGFGVF